MFEIIFGLISAAASITTSLISAHKTSDTLNKARRESLDIANKNRESQLQQQRAENYRNSKALSLREDQLSFDKSMAVEKQKNNEMAALKASNDATNQRRKLFEMDLNSGLLNREESASRLF